VFGYIQLDFLSNTLRTRCVRASEPLAFPAYMTFDIAIIGAGIVGAACAYRLTSEGLSVAIIEENMVGGGTTAAGMGHIVAMDDSEAQFALTRYSQKLWNELAKELPASGEYEFCGTIWIAADDEELLEAKKKQQFYKNHGVNAEILDEKSLREAEPNLRQGLAGGLLVESDSVVYQLSATKFFVEKALSLGAKLFLGKKAVEISNDGVKLADSSVIFAKKVINAAGIDAGNLTEGLGVYRKKGHLVITERYPNFVKHQLIELGYLKSAHSTETSSVAFNVQPRITGQVMLGSSRQIGVNDKAIDYNILRQMTNRAFEYIPKLRELSAVRVWTGFRPATHDNLPLIGQHPKFENVYLACGHEGLGITTSLGTAEILTNEIMGRESKIDQSPYSPQRMV
jgi:D-hydroxyproline dehydrogenase subunit beta